MPPEGPLTRFARRQPRLASLTLPLLPHLAGAAVDLTYNTMGLAAHPQGDRWLPVFVGFALGYTAVTLLATGWPAHVMTAPLWQVWQPLRQGELVDPRQLAAARRRLVRIPFWSLALSCAGWLPGAAIAPLVLAAVAGPVTADVCWHLALSFVLAGLIALTYCVYAALFMTIRVNYPELWDDAQGLWQIARGELAGVRRWVGALQLLGALVPLTAGAALLLSQYGARHEQIDAPGYRFFQLLLLTLILLGMLGSGLAAWLHNFLQQTLSALTGTAKSPAD